MDGVDVLSMQNWQHVELLLPHVNRVPGVGGKGGKEAEYYAQVDFSRVQDFYLQGHARHYRQTLVLGEYLTHDTLALIHGQRGEGGEAALLRNYAGLVLLRPEYAGELGRVVGAGGGGGGRGEQRQIFHRFPAEFLRQHDARFEYFVGEVWPRVKARHEGEGHVLLFVPQYVDFIRLRAHFKRRHVSYAALSEYSKASDVARSRTFFYQGRVRFLLMTERMHFFMRYRVTGVRHVVFYQLPQRAAFYAEIVNWMGSEPGRNVADGEGEVGGGGGMRGKGEVGVDLPLGSGTCVSLFCEWDARELERVVGSKRAVKMLQGEQSTFMFC